MSTTKQVTSDTLEAYLLLRALPDQINDNWPLIKELLLKVLPPKLYDRPEVMAKILSKLLSEDMQCWIMLNPTDSKPLAVVITSIVDDVLLMCKSLFVFALYGVDTLSQEIYQKGFETLHKFAIGNGCEFITGYTEHVGLLQRVLDLGGDKQMFLSVKVGDDENL